MSEWKKVKLGDCCEITSSKRVFLADYVPVGIPFYRSKEIAEMQKGKDISDPLFISNDKYEEIKRKYGIPHKGDLLLTAIGATLGIPYVIKNNDPFYFKDGNLIWFKNFNNEIDSSFLYIWMCSRFGYRSMQNIAIGSAQKALTISALKDLSILLPSIDVQQRIATILSRYDSLIENYQKQIKLLEEAAQRLYKEWFVDLHFPGHENTKIVDGVPEGWEKKRLIDLVDVQYGYAFDGRLFNSNGEGMPILRIRNIPDGITSDYTTEEASPNYIVHDGDIVVGMDGIFHINSWNGGDAYLVQRACSFRPKEESTRGYIFQAIQEPIKYFEQTLVGATVAHLGKKHIDSIELIVPANNDFYIPFQKGFKQRQSLLSQIRLLTEARDRLLPKLMSGEIAV